MKKTLIFIIILVLIFTAGCDVLIDTLEEYSSQNESAQQEISYDSALYSDMPSLPSMDFTDLNLFEDGYQIVEFDHAPDGDTAIFLIDGSYVKTRFLGVDTKEMSTDSGIPEQWAQQAKEFTNDMLENADQIILELDENSDTFDDYDRLLAWIWADGYLLNYMLAARGFADVKYLYDDYKYNNYLLDVEYLAQNNQYGIWGDDEPYYDSNENYTVDVQTVQENGSIPIYSARNMSEGSNVKVEGIITANIGYNAFIEDSTGGIYIFTSNKKFYGLEPGNQVSIEGILKDYNGLLEITGFTDNDIKVLSEGNIFSPKTISLDKVSEETEGLYVKIENAEITFINYNANEKGYSVFITQNGTVGEIRVDKYLESYPEPSSFKEGDVITVTGNVAQYYDSYQIMISSVKDIEINN